MFFANESVTKLSFCSAKPEEQAKSWKRIVLIKSFPAEANGPTGAVVFDSVKVLLIEPFVLFYFNLVFFYRKLFE